jgi:hypothetical protein
MLTYSAAITTSPTDCPFNPVLRGRKGVETRPFDSEQDDRHDNEGDGLMDWMIKVAPVDEKPEAPLDPLSLFRAMLDAVQRESPPGEAGADQWLTIVEAARHIGYPCLGGKAPNSVYDIAQKIGHKVNGRWVIALSELDEWIRKGGQR